MSRDLFILQHEDSLYHTGNASRALKVSYVSLDGPNDKRVGRIAVLAKGLGNCSRLPPVAGLGARAVAFHIGSIVNSQAGQVVNAADVVDLGLFAGQSDTCLTVST